MVAKKYRKETQNAYTWYKDFKEWPNAYKLSHITVQVMKLHIENTIISCVLSTDYLFKNWKKLLCYTAAYNLRLFL